jgi:hypothetical protein
MSPEDEQELLCLARYNAGGMRICVSFIVVIVIIWVFLIVINLAAYMVSYSCNPDSKTKTIQIKTRN